MFTFPTEPRLHQLIAEFYEAQKVTAALCHGTCALLFVKLTDGTPLIAGKTMTGFANVEEDFVDSYVGQKLMPFRIVARSPQSKSVWQAIDGEAYRR